MQFQKISFASLISVGLFTLGGCATVLDGPSYVEAQPKFVKDGKALVYVFRQYAEPTAWGATVHFDDKKVATLHQGGFTWAHLSPGTHSVKAVWPGLSAQRDSHIDLDVKAGNTYYVELTGTSRFDDANPGASYPLRTGSGLIIVPILSVKVGSGLSEVRPEVAEPIVSRCCKFQKPVSTEY